MLRYYITAILSLVISLFGLGESARILVVCPTASLSHQIVFRGLALALNERGHEIVIVTTDPLNEPNRVNYTEIDYSFMYNEIIDYNYIENRGKMSWNDMASLFQGAVAQSERMLEHPEFKKLYRPNNDEKFDLILLELFFWSYPFLPLSARFDAPIIGMTSTGLALHYHYEIGNPILPSHPSHWELDTKNFAAFVPWQRLDNFVETWRSIHTMQNEVMAGQEAIAREYFGNDIPSFHEILRNVSLIFVNQPLPISFARPNLPNIIEISNFHIPKRVEPLPQDFQKILDEATQGFVYMNLGTNVKTSMLSAKLRGEFTAAFSKLPYKVVWKFEDDSFPDKPDNVIIRKWMPQVAILAHPNIKVFIYQGGLQSTEEAISHVVPLIGFPVMGDQDMQVNKLVELGVARKLEITTVNRDDLAEAINAIATDDSYKEKMLTLRSWLQDMPRDPLKNAIWWTEHVIRHRGAPYLRSSLADEPWYQRGDMDIIAFLSAVFTIIFSLTIFVSYLFLAKLLRFLGTQLCERKIKLN